MSDAILLAVPVLPFAGALVLARWTRLHPLLAGAVAALPVGALALIVAGAAMSEAAVPVGIVAALVAAVPGMLGGFAGWLLRQRRIRRDRTG
ncbi:hypothetical protein [Sphingomonas sp. VNH70]|uniref:hypothetical protein n=1 Tax=Sphingomonas silueang TaxID=3156617 RepID=UPI0032B4D534